MSDGSEGQEGEQGLPGGTSGTGGAGGRGGGEHGLAGLPGQPGIQGGHGGQGGKGGRGGSVRHLYPVMMAMLALALVTSLATLVLYVRVDNNAATERHDRFRADSAIHATDFRLCYRGQVTRAGIDTNIAGDRRHHVPNAGRQLPLYDCRPNKTGGVAIRMTDRQAAIFENYVQHAPNLDTYAYPPGV